MLNFSDARSYGMVSHTFRLTYSPANDVFSVVFDMFENKQKIIYLLSTIVFYSVCQILQRNNEYFQYNRCSRMLATSIFAFSNLNHLTHDRRTNTLSFSATPSFGACLHFCKGRRGRVKLCLLTMIMFCERRCLSRLLD